MKRQQVKTLYLFMLFLVIFSIFINPFGELVNGFKNIIIESDILISDYFEIGGYGASLLNSSLLALGSLLLMRFSKSKINGMSIATILLMFGFGLFGKNIINVIPIVLGAYLFSLYAKEPFGNIVNIALLATSFSPIVTEIMFVINLNSIVRVILALLVGTSVGFFITPISRHLYNTHKGYNLYNVGFAIGLLSTLYVSIMKSYGFISYQRLVLSGGNNRTLSIYLFVFFLLTFIYGFILNKFSIKELGSLFKQSGYQQDFLAEFGVGTAFMNMAINGVISLVYVVIVAKGELNGPSIGGILTVYGFGAVGKHWRNILPIFIGVYLGSLGKLWNLSDTSSLFAALFGTALAPLVGKFGFLPGVLVSFINASVVLNSGFLHGGMNLYNTGFSVGLVAAVVVPLLEYFYKFE